MVLPEPDPPTSNVVRPRGRPPPVISSRPAMPVGALVVRLTRVNCATVIDSPWSCGREERGLMILNAASLPHQARRARYVHGSLITSHESSGLSDSQSSP